jgi:hypothetical protein
MAIVTFLAATPPTDSESGCLNSWEVLHQRLLLHGRLLNMEGHCCSCKPAQQSELRRHSSGIYVVLSKYWKRQPTDQMAILATIKVV